MSFLRDIGVLVAGGLVSVAIFECVEAAKRGNPTFYIAVRKDEAVSTAIKTGLENASEPKITIKVPSGLPRSEDRGPIEAVAGSYPLLSGTVDGSDYWVAEVPLDAVPRGEYIFTNSITTPDKIYEKDFGVTFPNDVGKVLPDQSLGKEGVLELRW